MEKLHRALLVALDVHSDQTDRQDEPYMLHVLRVVIAVPKAAQAVAAIHDVAEDSVLSVEQVADKVGLDSFEHAALGYLTRIDGEKYDRYISRIIDAEGSAGVIARDVKYADLRDNLLRVTPQLDGLATRYAKAFGRMNLAMRAA